MTDNERTWVTKDMLKELVVNVAFTGRGMFMLNFLLSEDQWDAGSTRMKYSHRIQFFHQGGNQILFDWIDDYGRMTHTNESAEKISPGQAIRFIDQHWDQKGSPELWTLKL